MGQLLEIGRTIVSDPLKGLVVLLVLLFGGTLWAYWQERKRNNEIQEERLIEAETRVAEAREDTKLMTTALDEASSAVANFKNSNDALRLAFETFVRTRSS